VRICYFVQNHLAPPAVRRLVGTIRRSQPDALFLVAHDQLAGHASTGELRQALEPLGADVFPIQERAQRGYFSVLQPYLSALEWLADRGVAYDWIVYLSAQDYPVRPLKSFEDLLATSGYDGFLRSWNALGTNTPWGRPRQGFHRYFYQYRDAPAWSRPGLRLLRSLNGVQPWMHIHLVYGQRVGIRRPAPFRPGLECHAGTQWSTLSRACAEHVLEQVRGGSPVVEWLRRTICPDEALIQTLLVNSGRFRLCNDDLRYADFAGSKKSGSPRVLTVRDLSAVTSGSHYFARKFDAGQDGVVLDRLDEVVG
jgi:hypothetical protein